jgi:hypothetical protein
MANTPRTGPLTVPLDDAAQLSRIQWHIDRYDRLRASTSSRAAVLLSANAALLTGTLVLANTFLQNVVKSWAAVPIELLALGSAATTVVAIFFCANAIATWRTTRNINRQEIPPRLMFNWGDTLRAVDGYSKFESLVLAQTSEEVLKNGIAELWTDILQHSRRHKHLRYAMHLFRAAVVIFLFLSVLVIIAKH